MTSRAWGGTEGVNPLIATANSREGQSARTEWVMIEPPASSDAHTFNKTEIVSPSVGVSSNPGRVLAA